MSALVKLHQNKYCERIWFSYKENEVTRYKTRLYFLLTNLFHRNKCHSCSQCYFF